MITPQNYQNLGLTDASDITSRIGASCTVGSIESEDRALLVEGTVKGDIFCTGAVIVAVNAKVLGSISAQNALIAGTVESTAGSITIDKTCILHATATVLCDVQAGALETAIGATFEGKISLNRNAQQSTQQEHRPIAAITHAASTTHAHAQTVEPPKPQPPHESDFAARAPVEAAALVAPAAATEHAPDTGVTQALTAEEEYAQDIGQIRASVHVVRNALQQGNMDSAMAVMAEIAAIDITMFKERQLQARVIIEDVIQQIKQCIDAHPTPEASPPRGPATPHSLLQGFN